MCGFRVSTRLVFLLVCLLQPAASPADTVAVRYPEGVSHGFLVLRTQDGKPIADGDSTQVARGDRVTSRMRFRFKDGSIYWKQRSTPPAAKSRLITRTLARRR